MSKQPTYTVSTWDHDANDWQPRFRRVRGARQAVLKVRELENDGWDRDASIMVERNYTKAEWAAHDKRLNEMLSVSLRENG